MPVQSLSESHNRKLRHFLGKQVEQIQILIDIIRRWFWSRCQLCLVFHIFKHKPARQKPFTKKQPSASVRLNSLLDPSLAAKHKEARPNLCSSLNLQQNTHVDPNSKLSMMIIATHKAFSVIWWWWRPFSDCIPCITWICGEEGEILAASKELDCLGDYTVSKIN